MWLYAMKPQHASVGLGTHMNDVPCSSLHSVQVFMLSTDDVLNERMLRAIVESGHSRVPIHKAGDRTDLVSFVVLYFGRHRLG